MQQWVLPRPLFPLALVRGVSRNPTLIVNGSYKALHYPPPGDPAVPKAVSLLENTPQMGAQPGS
uniref:Uncharacterized protein n=1 Tax=Megaselia scalaris TaxID=36166 RepID=T1GTG8_MEGSC